MTDKHTTASPSSSLKIYLRLLGYVRPYIGMFLISILGYIIFASTQPMLAGILKYFVDGLSNPEVVLFPTVPYLRDLQLLQTVPLLIVLIAAWQGLAPFWVTISWPGSRWAWFTTCVSHCSTASWCCRTAISTATTPVT